MIIGIITLGLLLLGAIIYIIRLTAEKATLTARIEDLGDSEKRFEAIAGEIMNRQRSDLRSETTSQMQTLLDPLRRELDSFSRSVSERNIRVRPRSVLPCARRLTNFASSTSPSVRKPAASIMPCAEIIRSKGNGAN